MTKQLSSSVSMSDIARIAGVSESTVSRALNNNKLISEKTRKKIQKLADSLNYKFNESARNLRLQKSHTVSAVVNPVIYEENAPFAPYINELINHIADTLSLHRYGLLYSGNAVAKKDWSSYLLNSKRADGVIVIGQGTDDTPLRRFQQQGNPVVVWGTPYEGTPYCTVGSDNQRGALLATQHLLSLGRRHIIFMGDIASADNYARYQGYKQALQKYSPRLSVHHLNIADSASAGYQSIHEIREKRITVDAILTATDNIALGVTKALQQTGLQVPQDISIIGFDDTPMAPYLTPALTTVRHNIKDGGELIAESIIKLIDQQPVQSSNLPVELVIRESCGASFSLGKQD